MKTDNIFGSSQAGKNLGLMLATKDKLCVSKTQRMYSQRMQMINEFKVLLGKKLVSRKMAFCIFDQLNESINAIEEKSSLETIIKTHLVNSLISEMRIMEPFVKQYKTI
jgi:hypothetical protein